MLSKIHDSFFAPFFFCNYLETNKAGTILKTTLQNTIYILLYYSFEIINDGFCETFQTLGLTNAQNHTCR